MSSKPNMSLNENREALFHPGIADMGMKPFAVRRGWRGALLLLLIGIVGGELTVVFLPPGEDWEPAITAFETQDRRQPPKPGQVVFAGSSSIRFWHTLAADMAPIPVLNRGFGGAHLRDVLRYADRIVTPYRPQAVVVYAGENDLGSR
jgi:hypothetical protein